MPLGVEIFFVEIGLSPGDFVRVRWGSSPLRKKGAEPPIFGPCLLWSNGWMDQGAAWYGGKPRPRRRYVRWGLSSLPKKAQPRRPLSIVAKRLYIRVPLTTEVGLSLGDIVYDGDPTPPEIKAQPTIQFWSMSIVAKRLDGVDGSRCHLVRR